VSKLEAVRQGPKLKISGSLDEEAQFPALDFSANETVQLDLKDVKSVNSVGIRTWLSWITPISQNVKFVFENVPHALVLQINMIEGFLPKTAEVASFFAPVYSEDKDEEDQILLLVGKDILKGTGGTPAQIKVDLNQLKGAGDWEFDVVEKTYFKFLNS
jgi:ABC-type transporter Mla MlaB component